jgi:hypothetical protein
MSAAVLCLFAGVVRDIFLVFFGRRRRLSLGAAAAAAATKADRATAEELELLTAGSPQGIAAGPQHSSSCTVDRAEAEEGKARQSPQTKH